MYKDGEWANIRHCATIFGTVRFFSEKFQKFLAGPARAYNYYARG